MPWVSSAHSEDIRSQQSGKGNAETWRPFCLVMSGHGETDLEKLNDRALAVAKLGSFFWKEEVTDVSELIFLLSCGIN